MRAKKFLLMLLTLIFTINLVNVTEIHASPAPTVTVTSVYEVKEPGVAFLVNITVTEVYDLSMWVIDIEWDPNIIKISTGDTNGLYKRGTHYNIYEGPLLKSMRATFFLANDVNNTGGKITALSAGYLSPGSSASGDGMLVTINFTSIDVGTTTIKITGPSAAYPGHSMLIDHTGKEMSHRDRNGVITENPPPGPPIWTQLWFQAALTIVIIAAVAAVFVAIRRRIARKLEEYPSYHPESSVE